MFDLGEGSPRQYEPIDKFPYIESAVSYAAHWSADYINSVLCDKNNFGWTPLHFAMGFKKYPDTKLFLEKADSNSLSQALLIQNDNHNNPLHFACSTQSTEICLQLIEKVSSYSLSKAMLTCNNRDRLPLDDELDPQVASALYNKLEKKIVDLYLPEIIHTIGRTLSPLWFNLILEKATPKIINYSLLKQSWPTYTVGAVTHLKKHLDFFLFKNTNEYFKFIYLLFIWVYSYLSESVADKKQRISEIEDWWSLTHKLMAAKENFYQTIKEHIENNVFFKTRWFYTSYKDIRNGLLKTRRIDDKIIEDAFNAYLGYLKLRQQVSEDELEKKVVTILLDEREPYLLFSKIEKTTFFGANTAPQNLLTITADSEPEPAKTISNAML